MESSVQEDRQAIRQAVRELCKDFPSAYWRDIDKHEKSPQEFVNALTASEYLAALIPEEHGGAGLGITEAGIILEEINHSGGKSGARPAQMIIIGTLLPWGRCVVTAATNKSGAIFPRSPRAIYACRPLPSPSRMPVRRPRASKHAPFARETATSSPVRRSSSHARSGGTG